MKGFVTGFVPAFVMSLAATAIVLFFLSGRTDEDPKLGWNRVSVLTAQRSFVAGEEVTEQGFAEAQLPQRFVSESCVRPEDAALIKGRPVTSLVRSGEVLTWAAFTQRPSHKPVEACARAIAPDAEAAAQQARDRAVEQLAQDAARDGGTPASLPGPPAGDGEIEVLAPIDAMAAGDRLHSAGLQAVKLPRAYFVASMVRADEEQAVEGARLLAASAAGEPLEWQYLDEPTRSGSIGACAYLVGEKMKQARQQAAAERATAWFAEHSP